MSDQSFTEPELEILADILTAAAYADGAFQLEEDAVVRQILSNARGGQPLTPEITERLDGFEPETFELAPACQALRLDNPARRRQLLTMVAQVTEADNVHDADEAHFIRRLARCIGASPREYRNLVFELTSGPEGRTVPPPAPRRRDDDDR